MKTALKEEIVSKWVKKHQQAILAMATPVYEDPLVWADCTMALCQALQGHGKCLTDNHTPIDIKITGRYLAFLCNDFNVYIVKLRFHGADLVYEITEQEAL